MAGFIQLFTSVIAARVRCINFTLVMIWLINFMMISSFLPPHAIDPLIINNRDVIAPDGQRYIMVIMYTFGNLLFSVMELMV